jgi:ABC-2 type transport system permease protein
VAVTGDRVALLAGDGARAFDPRRATGRRPRDVARDFGVAARLGWKVEGNWTDPVLFVIYSVAKPVASALLLVLMIDVIGGNVSTEYRSFVIVGSALWAFVVSGIAGLAISILDDRERYRMLKYVYVSPADFLVVLVGRGVARVAVGAMGAAITLVFGVLILGVPFDPGRIDWPVLIVAMVVGLTAVTAIGVLLAAVCLQTRQESWSYPEAFAGALFLVTGAVFPLAVLPDPVEAVGWLMPITWWVAAVRDSLFPGVPTSIGGTGSLWTAVTGTPAPSSLVLLAALLATGALGTLAASVLFGISERRAKEQGLLDRTTGS